MTLRNYGKKISPKTIYSVKLDSTELIEQSTTEINNQLQIEAQTITVARAKLAIDESGIASELQHQDMISIHSSQSD